MTALRPALPRLRQIGRPREIGAQREIRVQPRRCEDGFTLVEVLMATVVLVVGLLALLTILDTTVKASMTTRAREGGTNLARQIIEDARTIPYAQIVPTSIEGQLQAIKAEEKYPLADGSSASGWQIERRGFTYTVKVSECAIDNPKDGVAKTHGSTFCEGQREWKAGEVEDKEPEDLKRITVEASWTIQKHTATVKQVSTLTAAGQAIGLIAKELHLVEPPYSFNRESTAPVISEAATTTLTFSVSFPEGTSAIDWSLEGAKQEEITVSSKATSATFSWAISGISDGTYQVSAQAVNSTGVIGPPISIPVRLIRGTPKAPEAVGGFNTVYNSGVATEVGELQWKADSERDVIGYRVYGPSKELVCPESSETLSTATSCIDFKLPAGKPAERAYSVVALYRNATEEVKESSPSAVTIKQSESTAPNSPTNLVLTKNEDGSVTLKWTAPTGGAEVWFYRIYRGSTNYTSRYGETTETTFKDTDAITTHEYWVTAVGRHLTESSFRGPVTG